MRRAAAFHVTTAREGENSEPLMGGRPWFVVANPIRLRHPGSRVAFRRRRQIPEGEICLGMFGRLHRQKGHDVLFPALAAVRERPGWRLLLVGPDEEGQGRAMWGEGAGAGVERRVGWLGMLRDGGLADAYAGVDVVVLPSRGESSGDVDVDAVGRGCPVIVSDRVGLADWVAREGCGWVVANTDAWGKRSRPWRAREPVTVRP